MTLTVPVLRMSRNTLLDSHTERGEGRNLSPTQTGCGLKDNTTQGLESANKRLETERQTSKTVTLLPRHSELSSITMQTIAFNIVTTMSIRSLIPRTHTIGPAVWCWDLRVRKLMTSFMEQTVERQPAGIGKHIHTMRGTIWWRSRVIIGAIQTVTVPATTRRIEMLIGFMMWMAMSSTI